MTGAVWIATWVSSVIGMSFFVMKLWMQKSGFETILFDRQSHHSATRLCKFMPHKTWYFDKCDSPDLFLPVDTVEGVSKRSIR